MGIIVVRIHRVLKVLSVHKIKSRNHIDLSIQTWIDHRLPVGRRVMDDIVLHFISGWLINPYLYFPA